jgi:hypothetical protein
MQLIFIDYALERGGQHFLIAARGIRGIVAGERNARTAEDGDFAAVRFHRSSGMIEKGWLHCSERQCRC